MLFGENTDKTDIHDMLTCSTYCKQAKSKVNQKIFILAKSMQQLCMLSLNIIYNFIIYNCQIYFVLS